MKERLEAIREELGVLTSEIHKILDGVESSESVIAESLILGTLTTKIEQLVMELKEIDQARTLFDDMVAITELLIMTHHALEERLGVLEKEAFKEITDKIISDPLYVLSADEQALLDDINMVSKPQPLKVLVIGVAKPIDPEGFFGKN